MLKKLFITLSLASFATTVFSQIEYLSSNPQLSETSAKLKSNEQIADSTERDQLRLPFFDDFAYPFFYPLESIWADKYAFVNRNFPINPPTLGVATMDPFDENGAIYEDASPTVFEADKLTSRPINLKNYVRRVPSNELYIKENGNIELINNTYLYDAELDTYNAVNQNIVWYTASKQLFTFDGSNYVALTDSIFFQNPLTGNFEYILGSYEHTDSAENYLLSDSIMLSFYIQSKGIMDEPESRDSIVMQFYVAEDTVGIFINEIFNSTVELYNSTNSIVSISDFAIGPRINSLTNDTLSNYALNAISNKKLNPYDFSTGTNNVMQELWRDYDTLFLYNLNSLEIVDSFWIRSSSKLSSAVGRTSDGGKTIQILTKATLGQPNGNWFTMWSSVNDSIPNNAFVRRVISINKQRYLSNGFRFRFINHASLSTDESTARAEDFWHIDYVYLNSEISSNNTDVPDLAFTTPLQPFYKDYYSVPFKHAKSLGPQDFENELYLSSKNFSNSQRQVNRFFGYTNNVTKKDSSIYLNNPPFFPKEFVEDTFQLKQKELDIDIYDFLLEDFAQDSSSQTFRVFFKDDENTITEPYRWNDTISYSQNFFNYYAYDDGSAEAGFGLRGGEMLRAAYKFDVLQSDTLRAIDIYFNETQYSTSISFNLCIWAPDESNSSIPGELIYIDYAKKRKRSSGIFNFTRYEIDPDKIVDETQKVLVTGKKFFIGWQQPKDVSLNIGVDLNTRKASLVYQNFGFEWEPSLLTHPLMIRPVVGSELPVNIKDQDIKEIKLVIHPNPASETIYFDEELKSIEIYNITGQKLTSTYGSFADVRDFPSGIYSIKAINFNNQQLVGKFIKY